MRVSNEQSIKVLAETLWWLFFIFLMQNYAEYIHKSKEKKSLVYIIFIKTLTDDTKCEKHC